MTFGAWFSAHTGAVDATDGISWLQRESDYASTGFSGCGEVFWIHRASKCYNRHSMSPTTLGSLVARAQRRNGMSITGLAAEMRVHRTTLTRWIAGTRIPREEQMGTVSKVLRCSVDALREAIQAARPTKETVSA